MIGSMSAIFEGKKGSLNLLSLWTDGKTSVNFPWIKTKPPFDELEQRRELLKQLTDVCNLPIRDNPDSWATVPYQELIENERMLSFLATMDWAVGEIRHS
jgi:hypothetical protein